MGLLLGASVITLMEFLDLLCYNSCVKCMHSREKTRSIKVQGSPVE